MRTFPLLALLILIYTSCEPRESSIIGNDEGNLAAQIKTESISGEVVNLQSLQGKYVIIDFWASWCGPCLKEMPEMVALYHELDSNLVNFVSIAIEKDASRNAAVAQALQIPWSYQVVSESRFVRFNEFARSYGVSEIPSSFLIDPEGRVLLSKTSAKEIRQYFQKKN